MCLESKLVYFFSAALVSLATGMAAFQGKPDSWAIAVMAVGAIAQGLVAWKAFVSPPPTPTP